VESVLIKRLEKSVCWWRTLYYITTPAGFSLPGSMGLTSMRKNRRSPLFTLYIFITQPTLNVWTACGSGVDPPFFSCSLRVTQCNRLLGGHCLGCGCLWEKQNYSTFSGEQSKKGSMCAIRICSGRDIHPAEEKLEAIKSRRVFAQLPNPSSWNYWKGTPPAPDP